MHLTELSPGESAIITEINGGRNLIQQLALRGLTPGKRLTMISGRCGPVVVKIHGDSLVLGRGMAHKILLER
ncbi:FeoA family protein [Methanoplanus endosymbiosus]|uniref:Ferrous iron transport protein A n=1 Tax=Methanoplanus endosymbiosus TaxID=33865 RepID=A0A9E7TMQ4_9EURY|nr:FeoA family protein [Methanoplanus endosymbiosus]UUX93541.1 ferrous iron transport protein A [Methanoplanus endosymbiosus]